MTTNTCDACWDCLRRSDDMLGMIVCPTCGNKRCPHATFHENPCTGSNDPDQPGSRYSDDFRPRGTIEVTERVAYGDNTPSELADPIPVWMTIGLRRPGSTANGLAVTWGQKPTGFWVSCGPIGVQTVIDGLREPEARWWAGVAIAYVHQFPPHWYDLGMDPTPPGDTDSDWSWEIETDSMYAWASFSPAQDCWYTAAAPLGADADVVRHATEFGARCWTADRIGVEWRPSLSASNSQPEG